MKERSNWKPTFNSKTVVMTKTSLPGVKMFSGGYHPDKKIGWLEVLSVDYEHRQKGYGKKAVELFERWVKNQGGHQIRGEALQNSIPFWEKLGYTIGKKQANGRIKISKQLN